MLVIFYFVVHYTSGPSNTLFGSVRGMDRNIHFYFEGKALLFIEKSTPECNILILGRDEQTPRIIMSTAMFEGKNCTILRKPDFLFQDTTSDTD